MWSEVRWISSKRALRATGPEVSASKPSNLSFYSL